MPVAIEVSDDICDQQDFGNCKGNSAGPVFLVGSGASAADFPIREFSCIPMITMNGAISMFTKAGISPHFYVCSDRDFSRQQPELFAQAMRSSDNIALWDSQIGKLRGSPRGNVYALKKADRLGAASLFEQRSDLVRKLSLFSRRSRDIGFSKDMSLGFFDARTVMYLALQLAHHLGFSKVFLVGFDMNQSAGRYYETPGARLSPCGLDQHYESRILPSLKLMANSVMGDDFQVYNLSATSRVPDDIIPRLSLEGVRHMLGLSGYNG
ncbi:lipopolysaccharide biosynthesis protein [Pseudomonas viridiflava]|uniref:lipopolysaccharide biosynthesis protein n=1 Tax=Pseudomonas viridiflava TaxID=33069 RepID=UPI000F03EC3E|nr:lipopolysaccharide biosynthesis protein [Pseudomonas viridiflava]